MEFPDSIPNCICEGVGHCEIHNFFIDNEQDFFLCKRASPLERGYIKRGYKHKKESLERRKALANSRIKRYISTTSLVDVCMEKLLPQIYEHNISGVIGIPRSGMLPASIIALHLCIPLYTISDNGLVKCCNRSRNGGYRMKEYIKTKGPMLLVDDSLFSGASLNIAREALPEGEYLYAAAYVTAKHIDKLDIFGEIFDSTCFFDFHFFNSYFPEKAFFDIDGIFCKDIRVQDCDDGPKYRKALENAEAIPHQIPRLIRCHTIITGRLEKYREITERWLSNNKIRYEKLIMYPSLTEKERDDQNSGGHNSNIAKFKGDAFMASDATIFIESNYKQAMMIAKDTHKLVLCPQEGEVYGFPKEATY